MKSPRFLIPSLFAVSLWAWSSARAAETAVTPPGVSPPSAEAVPTPPGYAKNPVPAPGAPMPLPRPEGPTQFDLDFPGGTPGELVSAIEKATSKRPNVIIREDNANEKLPALKLRHVTAYQIFQGLEQVTRRTVKTVRGWTEDGQPSYHLAEARAGFKPTPGSSLSDDTIWAFFVENPDNMPNLMDAPPKACRFFSLAPYLDRAIYVDDPPKGNGNDPSARKTRNLTVDDITTAIETGWKLKGQAKTPELKFHKDTQLLIAVGDPGALSVIEDVLKALDSAKNVAPRPFAATLQNVLSDAVRDNSSSADRAREAMAARYGLRRPGSPAPTPGTPAPGVLPSPPALPPTSPPELPVPAPGR